MKERRREGRAERESSSQDAVLRTPRCIRKIIAMEKTQKRTLAKINDMQIQTHTETAADEGQEQNRYKSVILHKQLASAHFVLRLLQNREFMSYSTGGRSWYQTSYPGTLQRHARLLSPNTHSNTLSHPPSSWPHYGAISWWRCQRHTVISCSSFPCQLSFLEELTTDKQREQVTHTSCNTAQQTGPDWAAPGPAGTSPLFQNNLGNLIQ